MYSSSAPAASAAVSPYRSPRFEVFTQITLASRTLAKCEAIAASVLERIGATIAVERVDADNVAETAALIRRIEAGPGAQRGPALPGSAAHGRLPGDRGRLPGRPTTNRRTWPVRVQVAVGLPRAVRAGEPHGPARLGLRPGRDQRLLRLGAKHHFDEIHLDIIDCNAGDHGQHFATNFNPEINIHEIRSAAATGSTASGWRPTRSAGP